MGLKCRMRLPPKYRIGPCAAHLGSNKRRGFPPNPGSLSPRLSKPAAVQAPGCSRSSIMLTSAVHYALSHIFSLRDSAPLASKLHDDAMLEVFGHLQPSDLARAALVCTRWYDLAGHMAYESVALDTRTHSGQLLARTLRSCDHVLPHIRSITIVHYIDTRPQLDLTVQPELDWLKLLRRPHRIRSIRGICNHRLLEFLVLLLPALRSIPNVELFFSRELPLEKIISVPTRPLDSDTHVALLPAIPEILSIGASETTLILRVPSNFPSSSLSSALSISSFAYVEDYLKILEPSNLLGITFEFYYAYGPVPQLGMIGAGSFEPRGSACDCEEWSSPSTLVALWNEQWQTMLAFVRWRAPFSPTKFARILDRVHRSGRAPSGIKVNANHGPPPDHPDSEVCETCGSKIYLYVTVPRINE